MADESNDVDHRIDEKPSPALPPLTRETLSRVVVPSAGGEDAVSLVMENCGVKAVLSAVMGSGLGFMMGVFFTSMSASASVDPRLIGAPPGMPQPSTWQQVRDGFRASGRQGLRLGKAFGVAGGLFVASECVIEKYRGRTDIYNSLLGGCAAGAALSFSGGPQAMCMGCLGFAAFSGAIDIYMER